MKILFVSRGVGLGHFTRDVLLARAMSATWSASVLIASYGVSVQFARTHSILTDIVDLSASGPFDGVLVENLVRLFRTQSPDLIISDEELFTGRIAKGFRDVPVIYLTNWLPSTENAFLFSLLQGFDKIVIADVPGSIVVPMIIQHKVVCVGPIVDRAQHTYVSQTKGAPPKISVVAGGGVQADLPFWEKTIQAIGALSESCEVHLYPGSWFPIVASLCKQYSQHQWCVTKDYADLHHALDGCNVVIARSGHTTNWEIAVRRIPAILFPHDANTNPMSAEYAKHIQNYTPAIVHQVGDSVRCIAEDLRVLIKKPPNMPMVEIPDGVPTFLQQVFPYC